MSKEGGLNKRQKECEGLVVNAGRLMLRCTILHYAENMGINFTGGISEIFDVLSTRLLLRQEEDDWKI